MTFAEMRKLHKVDDMYFNCFPELEQETWRSCEGYDAVVDGGVCVTR